MFFFVFVVAVVVFVVVVVFGGYHWYLAWVRTEFRHQCDGERERERERAGGARHGKTL